MNGWSVNGPKVTFEYVRDVNNGREYVKVEKPTIDRRIHIPLHEFLEAAERLRVARQRDDERRK